MMCSMEKHELKFRVMHKPVIAIKPLVNYFYPLPVNNKVYREHNGKENHRKSAIRNNEIPRRNQDDVCQYSGSISMQDFKSNVGVFFHDPLPWGLHQYFTH